MQVLGDLVRKQSRLIPERVALIDPLRDRTLTYGELFDRSTQLASALTRLGLNRGDRVAMMLSNCHVSAELIFGITRAGLIMVNVNERLRAAEVEFILADSGAEAIITEKSFTGLIRGIAPALPGLKHLVSIDSEAGWLDFEELLAAESEDALDELTEPDDTAVLIYTSGTTGKPKGVELTHRSLMFTAANFLIEAMHERDGTYLACMPYFHVVCVPHMAALMRGLRVVVTPFDLGRVVELIERYQITDAFFVPTMIALLLQAEELRSQHDLSSLRTILYAAAPMPVAVLRRALATFGPIFCQMYGLTESSSLSTILNKDEHVVDGGEEWTARLASCGREVTRVEVRVLRLDGAEANTGEMGEIAIRGENLMKGYWGRPEATAESLREGWFHTGDMGKRDGAGFIYILDRKNDMIITGGFNVYPREVEEILFMHPAVLETAVIGIPDETWGETVLALLVLRPDCVASTEEMIAYCAERLADYKKPRQVKFLDALPRSAAGKIDKLALRADYWKSQERQVV